MEYLEEAGLLPTIILGSSGGDLDHILNKYPPLTYLDTTGCSFTDNQINNIKNISYTLEYLSLQFNLDC